MSALIIVLAFLGGLAGLIALMARLEPVVAPAPVTRTRSAASAGSAEQELAPQVARAAA